MPAPVTPPRLSWVRPASAKVGLGCKHCRPRHGGPDSRPRLSSRRAPRVRVHGRTGEPVSVETSSLRLVLEHGRASCANGAWVDAFQSLTRADETRPLEPDDLELLATAAYMLGRDDDYARGLERAHYGHLDAGDVPRAARCTWWIGLCLLLRGEAAPATGWFARGERLLDREHSECAARGYLRLAYMLERFGEGDFEAAHDAAAEAIEVGERFKDRDLVAMGVMDQGHALI